MNTRHRKTPVKQLLDIEAKQKKKKVPSENINESQPQMGEEYDGIERLEKIQKANILSLLVEELSENNKKPEIIEPWIDGFKELEERIFGQNYVIVGPSQAGKHSCVRYALGTYHNEAKEILINCQIQETQTQFLTKMVYQMNKHCLNLKKTTRQISKIINNENIDFDRLSEYIIKKDTKIVIILKNGERLVELKRQLLLYTLFEWTQKPYIKELVGLVLLSKNLRIVDLFEKRVKSRFAGHTLRLFRPSKAESYISILTRRIEMVLQDKIKAFNFLNEDCKLEEEENNSFFEESSEVHEFKSKKKISKGRSKSQKNTANTRHASGKLRRTPNNPEKMGEQNAVMYSSFHSKNHHREGQNQEIEGHILQSYLNYELQQKLGLEQYELTVASFEESSLGYSDQIDCLEKLGRAVKNNKELSKFLQKKIDDRHLITIPFILRIFMHVIISLDEKIVRDIPKEDLSHLICVLIAKNVNYEFPENALESNFLESLTEVEILLLIIVYRMVFLNAFPIKLKEVYSRYKSSLRNSETQQSKGSAYNYSAKQIELSWEKLLHLQIIKFAQYGYELWNTQAILLYEPSKVKKGLQYLIEKQSLPEFFKAELKDTNIKGV